MSLTKEERAELAQLAELVTRRRARPHGALADGEAARFLALHRAACTSLARLRARDPLDRALPPLERLLAASHAELARRPRSASLSRALRFLWIDCPRALREEWRLLALTGGLVYGGALLAFLAVRYDLDLAFYLLDAQVVHAELAQLEALAPGEAYRGNFDFGLVESPAISGWIAVHNIGVGLLLFATALIPPLYAVLMGTNALMLGTYTAVASHYGQAGSISSILWCHGVLEIQALVLAGAAGLALTRGALLPGARTRGDAMRAESQRAWTLLAPMIPMLLAAGLIEGFVSPHAPLAARLGVAVVSGLLLMAWLLRAGQRSSSAA